MTGWPAEQPMSESARLSYLNRHAVRVGMPGQAGWVAQALRATIASASYAALPVPAPASGSAGATPRPVERPAREQRRRRPGATSPGAPQGAQAARRGRATAWSVVLAGAEACAPVWRSRSASSAQHDPAATTSPTAGATSHVVANRLGHADPSTTLPLYAHVLREQAAGAAEIFAGAVEAAVSKGVSR